ncbi:MAG: hypothetical protein AAF547_10015 [Actinomycetota bacterium]
MLLNDWGSTETERAAGLPGDELLDVPAVSATRSISLGGSPAEVAAWLRQMGTGRAGWYSYDLIDNLGRRSADRLVPAWQVSAPGQQLPAGPIAFDVTHLVLPPDPDAVHELVLAILDRPLLGHRIGFTLAYRAISTAPNITRLVTRARIRIDGPVGRPAAALLGFGDGLMVRRQLLGLRTRCGEP